MKNVKVLQILSIFEYVQSRLLYALKKCSNIVVSTELRIGFKYFKGVCVYIYICVYVCIYIYIIENMSGVDGGCVCIYMCICVCIYI